MKPDLRTRFGFWLEKFPRLDWLTFAYDGEFPGVGGRYVNRVNGHVIIGVSRGVTDA